MVSLLDRLLGRSPEPTAAKATNGMTGAGAFALDTYPPVSAFSVNPNRLMNEELKLFRTNAWVALAERTIIGPILDRPWHLEDETGDTISDEPGQADPPTSDELALLNLLRRPQPKVTYRQQVSRTLRHEGLAGNAFWYLDQRNLLGLPAGLIYINPVRMTYRHDANGNLLGWVLDGPDNPITGKVGSDGVPFEPDEIRQFRFDEPDLGEWGIGIPEAAQTKIELDRLATLHSSQVFASGGRLTGIVTPKVNSGVEIEEDQWKSLVREWRNVGSDPEAAKRLIVARGPVDFIQTSANNEQLQLNDLHTAARDDVLLAWGIPVTQAGGSAPAGLNSGTRQGFDEATLWQKPIAYRLRPFLEVMQGIVDLWQAVGVRARFVLDIPHFDDDTPQYDKAVKAKVIPLTIDQRLAQVGADPLDEAIYGSLGKAIYLDQTMVPIFTPSQPASTATPDSGLSESIKATLVEHKLLGLRARLQPAWQAKVHAIVVAHLAEQRQAISDNVRQRYAQLVKKPKDSQAWWNAKRWDELLSSKLEPLWAEYGRSVGLRATRTLRNAKADDGWLARVIAAIRDHSGRRIVGINETTQARVQQLIEDGVAKGLGPAALGDLIEDDAIFDAARSDLIVRTETALVYNEAALGSYSEFGVTEVEAIDGDQDEECAARDGQTFSLDEAEAIEDHPNGTLDWIPVADSIQEPVVAKADVMHHHDPNISIHIPEKMALEMPAPQVSVEAPHVTVNLPEQPPQHVTVNVPEQPAPVVNLPAPVVHIEAPKEPAKASLLTQVEVVSMPRRVHRALRDKAGTIQGSDEVDA